MTLPEKIQQQRNELVQQVIKDIQSGKPFFWDSGYISKRPRNLLKSLQGLQSWIKALQDDPNEYLEQLVKLKKPCSILKLI